MKIRTHQPGVVNAKAGFHASEPGEHEFPDDPRFRGWLEGQVVAGAVSLPPAEEAPPVEPEPDPRLAELEAENADLRERAEALDGQNEALREEVADFSSRVAELTGQKTHLENEKARLEACVRALEAAQQAAPAAPEQPAEPAETVQASAELTPVSLKPKSGK